MSDQRSSKTQAAAQWLRDLAHRITLYDVDERRLREIAAEIERAASEPPAAPANEHVTAEHIKCWRTNYGLDRRTPAEAMQWWLDNAGHAPAGAVAALGLCIAEIERLQRRVAELDALVKELSDELYAERELYARGL